MISKGLTTGANAYPGQIAAGTNPLMLGSANLLYNLMGYGNYPQSGTTGSSVTGAGGTGAGSMGTSTQNRQQGGSTNGPAGNGDTGSQDTSGTNYVTNFDPSGGGEYPSDWMSSGRKTKYGSNKKFV